MSEVSYTVADLKPSIVVTATSVECPVAGCERVVSRQRGRFRVDSTYLCPDHRIYISPSTFEYADVRRNFPLIDDGDWRLLMDRIAAEKRETHRLARERSEDAVTYNAFRSIERAGRLTDLIAYITDRPQESAELVYWSHSIADGAVLPALNDARQAFGEAPARGSEPDLIAITPSELLFIEVKVASGNNTQPSRPEALSRYAAAQGSWYEEVFASDPVTVAQVRRKYELMRFWLLGTWMAAQAGKRFTLVSLTREIQDMDLDAEVFPLLHQNERREFAHWPWEAIADWAAGEPSTVAVADYLWSKSIGYDSSGRLQPMLIRIAY